MRKCLLLCCIGLFVCSTARAQIPFAAEEDRLRGFHLALTAGVNFTDIKNPFDAPDPEIDHVLNPVLGLGLLGSYQFDDVFGLRTGVLYTKLGRQAEERFRILGESLAIEKTVDLTYIQIPLIFRLNASKALTGFYAEAGLVYSLLQSAEVVRNGEMQPTETLFRDTEIGVHAEVGPSLALNEQVYLTLGVRGYIGVTDLNPETLDTTGLLVGKSQNRALGLHLTLNYMLSRRP